MAATLTPIVPKPASEKGALDGFQCRCSCGLVISSSLLTICQSDAAAHLAWHERNARAAEHDAAAQKAIIEESIARQREQRARWATRTSADPTLIDNVYRSR